MLKLTPQHVHKVDQLNLHRLILPSRIDPDNALNQQPNGRAADYVQRILKAGLSHALALEPS
jgi:hypothetical protein